MESLSDAQALSLRAQASYIFLFAHKTARKGGKKGTEVERVRKQDAEARPWGFQRSLAGQYCSCQMETSRAGTVPLQGSQGLGLFFCMHV